MSRKAITALTMLLAGCAGRDIRNGEAVVRRSIAAAANNETLAGVQIELPDSLPLATRRSLAAAYTLKFLDNELAGTRLKDLLSTGWMLWDVQYSDGRRWEAEALRQDTLWVVVLRPGT